MLGKLIILIIVVSLAAVGFYFFSSNEESVCVKERCFEVEIVDNDKERSQGLMFREFLEEDAGMFFVFDSSDLYPFWMKNTLIPLDIIWIDENKEVVYISNAVPCEKDPCRNYNPNVEALYVLEVNGGIADEIGLEIGDEVVIQFGN